MGNIPICCAEEKSPDAEHETMVAEVAIRVLTCSGHGNYYSKGYFGVI